MLFIEKKVVKEVSEMTMKETVNLIHGLKKMGLSDSQIVNLFEFIESSDPKILEKLGKPENNNDEDNAR